MLNNQSFIMLYKDYQGNNHLMAFNSDGESFDLLEHENPSNVFIYDFDISFDDKYIAAFYKLMTVPSSDLRTSKHARLNDLKNTRRLNM